MLHQKNFKVIRQRLGWSLAEMARRMGCSTELVVKWESLKTRADSAVVRQYEALLNQIEIQCEFVRQSPLAETYLKDGQLQQASSEEVTEWEKEISSSSKSID